MNTVAFVPIKLNNQRLKNKNILPLDGKPLCHHVFEALLKAEGFDAVYCYCSDEKIREYIPKEVRFLKRDPSLDGDTVKGFEIYDRFISDVDADIYALCHATSPFLRSETVSRGIRAIKEEGYDSAFTALRQQTFAWYQGRPLNYDIHDVPRTQEIKPVYVETSAFFIFRKEVFTKMRQRIGENPFICETGFIESVDIDEPEDYELAKRLAMGGIVH